MLLTGLAIIPLMIWIYLLAGRGGFWRLSKHIAPEIARHSPDTGAKRIAVIIPARNEAPVIGQAIRSLFDQEMPSPLRIIVVDDGSSDGTPDIARNAAKQFGRAADLIVINGSPLPSGWTGKLWAISQGIRHAEAFAPDYFLFTDADIVHGRRSVPALVAIAEGQHCDLASYMVKLACHTPAEKALIPAFVFFFFKLYPPSWIASARYKTAGAAGGCILIRPDALHKIGGIAAIRNEVIDDCALAKAVKRGGGRVWMGLTGDTESIRSYGTFGEMARMISRTAFSQLDHSLLLLIAVVAGLFFTYLLPPLLLLTGQPLLMGLGAVAWVLMGVCYCPMVRFYRRPAACSMALPFIALFYLSATIHSALQYWRGRGGQWKGRIQDARL